MSHKACGYVRAQTMVVKDGRRAALGASACSEILQSHSSVQRDLVELHADAAVLSSGRLHCMTLFDEFSTAM
jgi:hypothetical protein